MRAGQGHRRASSWLGAVASAALVAVLAAPAQAAPPVTIAEGGAGAGKVASPRGVAVHQGGGELYVAEHNNRRVSKFGPGGEFLLAFGYGVADGTSEELQTCGPEASPPTARCFGITNPGEGNLVVDAVAVDNSGGEGDGEVYVSDTGRRVLKFDSSGQLIFMVGKGVNKTTEGNLCTAASGALCGRGSSGTGPREFESSSLPLAVDGAGQVWVGDDGRLVELNPDGTAGAVIEPAGAGDITSLALDSEGDFYVIEGGVVRLGVHKHAGPGAAVPGEELATLEEAHRPRTVAIDAADNVFIGHCVITAGTCQATPRYRFVVYNPALEQVSEFGAEQVIGTPGAPQGSNAIAVGEGAGVLYAASSQPGANSAVQAFGIPAPGPLPDNPSAEALPSKATLKATLNPEGNATEYHFEYGTSEAYGEETEEQTLPGAEFDSEAVEAEIGGLLPETTYHFRLVATNHCNAEEPAEECTVSSEDATFTTPATVAIEAQWATEIGARGATARARLNPLGTEEEAQEAKWWIEYGEGDAFDRETAKLSLPPGFDAVAVAVRLSGLEPATTYGYRFAASSKREGVTYEARGEDRRFTTQSAGLGFELPDRRAWEMVTPAEKFGARLRSPSGGHVQAAVDGEGLAYLSRGSIEAHPEGSRSPEDTSALALRTGPGEWASEDLTPPNQSVIPLAVGLGLEYKLFSPGLTEALLEPRGTSPLAPYATERAPYLRHNADPRAYEPLVVGCPLPPEPCPPAVEERANVLPPGTEFGIDPTRPSTYSLGAARIAGSSPDLAHVVVGSTVPLALGAAVNALYMWEAGGLTPVSVLPGGGGAEGAALGSGPASARNAVSADGKRVFFGSGEGLYVRDLARGETARLDTVQGGFGGGGADPVFQGADPRGDVALFTDSRDLTPEAGEEGRDLYRCEIEIDAEGKLACDLTDISGEAAEAVEPGQSSEVQGLLAGMAEDAGRAFFVARGVLDAKANQEEEVATEGKPNLYAWSEGGGARFIATLAEGDYHDWGLNEPGGQPIAAQRSAAASPSGRYLAFMSALPLSGYDNTDAASPEPCGQGGPEAICDQEVFRYDAVAEELICASCNPSGARPRGLRGFEGRQELAPAYDPQKLWAAGPSAPAVPLAAVLPEATRIDGSGASLYRPRAAHDNGRLFFNAADSLVGADSNGDWDVYQYEPTGAGDCSGASSGPAVARGAGGCVSLISSGTAGGESAFIDASEGGDDVFFWTDARLAVTDKDEVTDIYDARVGGTEATATPVAECLGEACQPAASAPEAPAPASAAFQGPGNLAPASRGRCARPARKAKRISRRAKRVRRGAKRAGGARKAKRMRRKAHRLARRAAKTSKRAKRCRARARKRSSR